MSFESKFLQPLCSCLGWRVSGGTTSLCLPGSPFSNSGWRLGVPTLALLGLLVGCSTTSPEPEAPVNPYHPLRPRPEVLHTAPIAPFDPWQRPPEGQSGPPVTTSGSIGSTPDASQSKAGRKQGNRGKTASRSGRATGDKVIPWPKRSSRNPSSSPTREVVSRGKAAPRPSAPSIQSATTPQVTPPGKTIHSKTPERTIPGQLPYEDYFQLAPYLHGVSSWYGPDFHGKPTASGEIYNQHGMTAAHPVLPMHTRVRVKYLENGREVVLRINDRGPYKKGRILDLSRTAAQRLGILNQGTGEVKITIESWPPGMDPSQGLAAYRQFVVQVEAFQELSKAEARRSDLAGQFDDLPLQVERTPRGRFAILAGPYDNEELAQQVSRDMKKSGVASLVRSYRK